MIWLYRVLFLPALLLGAPFYLRRMWRRGGYREDFGQRFGRVPALPAKRAGRKRVWLQAVSVGEVLAVGPLLEAWRLEGGVEVYLTTTTSTGHRLARERYGELTLAIAYFPLDWWPFSARAWRAVRPDLVILTEGERWPEHIRQAARRGVPVLAVNARLSDRSFGRMRRMPAVMRSLFGGITRVLAAAEPDAARFRALGFAPEQVVVTGNIKLDVAIPRLDAAARTQLRRELGLSEQGWVLMGASTWDGEEVVLLAALRAVRAAGLACSLLIVPRHAERRGELEAWLQGTGLRYHLRSSGSAAGEVDVAVADTTGELRALLQLADLVFVGKSLPPHTEGQTPVEAAALGRPVLFGPGMGNFRVIARDLTARGAAGVVADAGELAAQAVTLLGDSALREQMAEAARAWHAANAGAVERTLAIITAELAG